MRTKHPCSIKQLLQGFSSKKNRFPRILIHIDNAEARLLFCLRCAQERLVSYSQVAPGNTAPIPGGLCETFSDTNPATQHQGKYFPEHKFNQSRYKLDERGIGIARRASIGYAVSIHDGQFISLPSSAQNEKRFKAYEHSGTPIFFLADQRNA